MERHTFRTSQKKRWCSARIDLECFDRIEAGERYCDSVISPQHDDIGNERWWRAPLCLRCAAYYGHVDPILPAVGDA